MRWQDAAQAFGYLLGGQLALWLMATGVATVLWWVKVI